MCGPFFTEEDQIAEIHCAKSDEQEKVHQIGDIYVAKVQNIVQKYRGSFFLRSNLALIVILI